MSQQLRQAEIFAGEDWTVLYRAFTQINFNSYDPPSINRALRDYIQTNYPEDFNDWIESSEFVAIIDLLSWLAGSLAFRTDINARENFLETAQARESVLRLARFLSYNPRRAQSARGLVKLVEVKTSQSIQDSFGVNLNNRAIKWNDPDNPDWMEQFTLVLNAAMPTTNPFGVPFKTAKLGGTVTQLYRLTSLPNPQCAYRFNAIVDGDQETFEIVNMDIEEQGFNERVPDPNAPFHMVYRNDGRGNDSVRSGFFLMFKQGTLNQRSFDINTPLENRLIEIDVENISETDVWVQSIDDSDAITSRWTKVPAIYSENITFNSIAADVRDIFSVVTRDDDRVTLRFGDGRFGTVPVGGMRVWYRTVNGLQYQLRPRDMESISIVIPYSDTSGRKHDLTMRFSLQESITNAVSSEDIDQIRRRAPQVYGTQNRMVSGEDYNVFPLSTNEIIKLRAVNRVYSGHSRYIDINDPTATLQDTVVFADDGILYRDYSRQYTQVSSSTNLTSDQMVSQKIQPMLNKHTLRDYYLDFYSSSGVRIFPAGKFVWLPESSSGFSSTGSFNITNYASATLTEKDTLAKYFGLDSMLLFSWISQDGKNSTVKRWAKVSETIVNSTDFTAARGANASTSRLFNTDAITLNEVIPSGASVVQIIPAFRAKLEPRTLSTLPEWDSELAMVADFINKKKPFRLYYQPAVKSALKFSAVELNGRWIATDPNAQAPVESQLIMTGTYVGGLYWAFEVIKGVRYVFESTTDVRWHDIKDHKVLDGVSGEQRRDSITLIWPNRDHNEIKFDIVNNIYDPDGYPDYRRIVVTPTDSDDDGTVDEPDSFRRAVFDPDAFNSAITNSDGDLGVVIFKKDTTSTYNSLVYTGMKWYNSMPTSALDLTVDEIVFVKSNSSTVTGTFYRWTGSTFQALTTDEASIYVVRTGMADYKFQWQHFADSETRIDPAVTNIIDVFVLTSEYDYLVKQWIANGVKPQEVPTPPTDLDLQMQFRDFEQYKMFSDQIVWRPVKYKYLFGEQASAELKAQFKIVKLPGSTLSDGEIRTKVIGAINEFFDVNKWEFGETFYFTELAAYIHFKLATAISSVVIVPLSSEGKFGELFEVRCATDEVFISTAQVDDVVIIDGNSMANLRIS